MNDRSKGEDPVQSSAIGARLQCQVLASGDSEYDQARRVWNGMIDRKPAMIVRPTSIADVMQAVRIAR